MNPEQDTPVILAVDDEAVVRALISDALSPRYQVLCARDGDEALKVLRSRRVDLVLTDIRMPVLGGLLLSDMIYEEFPELPLAFVSSYLDGDFGKQADRRSPFILAKPFEVRELLALVRRALGRHHGRAVPTLAAPPIRPLQETAPAVDDEKRPYRPSKAEEMEDLMEEADTWYQPASPVSPVAPAPSRRWWRTMFARKS